LTQNEVLQSKIDQSRIIGIIKQDFDGYKFITKFWYFWDG